MSVLVFLVSFFMVASVVGVINALIASVVFIGGLFGSIHLIHRLFKVDLITICFVTLFILSVIFILNLFRF